MTPTTQAGRELTPKTEAGRAWLRIVDDPYQDEAEQRILAIEQEAIAPYREALEGIAKAYFKVPAGTPTDEEVVAALPNLWLAIEAARSLLAAPSSDAYEARIRREERERLTALFDQAWRREVGGVDPDGEDAAIGYALQRTRRIFTQHRDEDPYCDCESCRSIAAEDNAFNEETPDGR